MGAVNHALVKQPLFIHQTWFPVSLELKDTEDLCLRLFNPHHLKIHEYHHSGYFSSSVISLLNSCKSIITLKQIHASIVVSNGQDPAFAVGSKLTFLYAQFNDFGSSVSVLKAMKESNTFLWNSVIKAHVNAGLIESAFSVYKLMRENGVSCDGYTFPILSKLVVFLESGGSFSEMIHCVGMQMGFDSDVYFCNTVIDAYVKSGCYRNALKLFEEMPMRDLVSWTSMISGCVYQGNVIRAFGLFSEMQKEVEPNEVTIIVMLQTCSNLFEGRQFHGYVIKCGSLTDQSLKNSILKMYADFGSLAYSEILFEETNTRDVVSWNIMIHLYSSKRETMKMADCLSKMRGEVEPSIETFTLLTSGLSACGNHRYSQGGSQIHCLALKSGLFDDILMTSLLDLYAKSGDLENSTKLFTEISHINHTSWDAMMSGWIENGYFEEAIELFNQMLASNFQPKLESIRTLVIACMHLGALRLGKTVHGYFARKYFFPVSNEDDSSLETSILNMYIKCGDISSARNHFNKMLVKDLVTWSLMIEGYGAHGLASEALETFNQMRIEGIEPNSVTFLSLLSACSHSGFLHQGCKTLNSMTWEFEIEPDLDHYTCIVDLLGRCGRVKEALSVILKRVPFPDSRIWAAVLAAARVHEDQKVGKFAAEKILEMGSDNAGYYTLFSNVHASVERWHEVEEVRSAMKGKNLIKNPGWSCLEVKGAVHRFVSGDKLHFQKDEIYAMVECLSRVADVGNVLYN